MEAPRHWRMTPTKIGFSVEMINDTNEQPLSLRLPWGEIPLSGGIEEVNARLEQKGFNEKEIEKILLYVFGGVTTESSISSAKIIEGDLELFGAEVREEYRSEVEL